MECSTSADKTLKVHTLDTQILSPMPCPLEILPHVQQEHQGPRSKSQNDEMPEPAQQYSEHVHPHPD
jgi:hypothetical protein